MQVEFESGDYSEVAAAASQRPDSSGFSDSEACTTDPSAMTTSAESRLSQVSPYLRRTRWPEPPPNVKPPMPGWKPGRRLSPVRALLSGRVEVLPSGAAAGERPPGTPIDLDRVQLREVENDSVVTRGKAGTLSASPRTASGNPSL